MRAAPHRHHADAVLAGELDREVGGVHACDLARSVVGIDERGGAVSPHYTRMRIAVHQPRAQPLCVDGDAGDPVRVHAAPAGGDERGRDGRGGVLAQTRGHEQVADPSFEVVGGQRASWHGLILTGRAARRRAPVNRGPSGEGAGDLPSALTRRSIGSSPTGCLE
ncbi:MAG: hypothetical protein H0X35_07430 [Pseudonocardiales bacterium]|nr:hypothetical protein [Pseudonocardiales bacterium]